MKKNPPGRTKRKVNVNIDDKITYFYDFVRDDVETCSLVKKAQQEPNAVDGKWNPKYKLSNLTVLHTFAERINKNCELPIEKKIELKGHWKLMYRVKKKVLIGYSDEFYGELYFNIKNSYLLMVIKGSSSVRDVRSTIKNISFGYQGGPIDSAFTFGEKVRKLITKFKCKPMLLITGQSLGGYLAQIVTYTITYCFVDDNNRVRSREEPSEEFGIYGVVFDSPGAQEEILRIDPRNPVQFERFRLPIINFIVNINECNDSSSGPNLGIVLPAKELHGFSKDDKKDSMKNTSQLNDTSNQAHKQEAELQKTCTLQIQEANKNKHKIVSLKLYPLKFAERLKVYTQLPTICKLLIGELPKYTQTTTEIIIEDNASIEEFIPQAIQVFAKSKEFLEKEDLQNKILNFQKSATSPEEELLYSDQAILMEGTEKKFESANEFAWELAKGKLRFVVISSEAGMGKSTALKQVAQTLRQRLPHYLIIILDLFEFQNELCQFKETMSSKEEAVDLVKNLVLAEFKDEYLLKLSFNSKTESKEMMILLDSLDKVCPLYREVSTSLIERLRESDIQIVVTTRPNEGKTLRGAENFTLEPLCSNFKKLEFLKNRFTLMKMSQPSNLHKWLHNISIGIDADFWTTPLSLVIAVYIFGTDTEIGADECELRRKNIYKEYLNKSIDETLGVKMEIDKNRASTATDYKNKFNKYNKLVEVLAICTIFHSGEVIDEFKEKIRKKGEFINNFDVAKLDHDCKNVSFLHKSYAEYLTARVFVLNLMSKTVQLILNDAQLKTLCCNQEFRAIRGHICGFLASSTIEKVIFLPEIIKGEERKLLELLIKEDCFELYMLLKDCLWCAHDNFVMKNYKGEEINLLYLALERARESFVKELLKEGANFENILHMKDVLRYAVEKNLYEQLQAHTKGLKLSIQRGEHFKSLKHVFAMKSGSREMAELLIENGLEVSKDAIYYVEKLEDKKLAEYLRKQIKKVPGSSNGVMLVPTTCDNSVLSHTF